MEDPNYRHTRKHIRFFLFVVLKYTFLCLFLKILSFHVVDITSIEAK